MKEKISDRIYTEIRKEIIDGVYSARDFISEQQIADRYGVSKAPVKEALHVLADQGFLVGFPRRGYMVNTYSDEEINKIQEVRRALETLCIKKVIKEASDEDIRTLRVYRDDRYEMNPRATINYSFHIGLARLTGNEFLVESLSPLVSKASMTHIKSDPDVENFEKIVDALLERDEKKAISLLEDDIRYL